MRVLPTLPAIAWLTGIPLSYFAVGFSSNFHTSPYIIFLLATLIHVFASLLTYSLLGKAKQGFSSRRFDTWIALILFASLAAFGLILFKMAEQFPSLSDAGFYHLEGTQWIPFAIGLLLALPIFGWMLKLLKGRGIRKTPFGRFVDENLAGLLLSFCFFSIYLFLSAIFNQPAFDADDIFFDSDARLWRWRFATEQTRDYYWRPVHPFVLIIVRPFVWLISLFIKGDTLYAAFVLNAFAGALCVFIVWYLVKRWSGNTLYAMLVAALFGASTAQLIFSSLIETYIYLAAVALVFLLLLVTDKPLYMQVIAGLVAFGITISNLAQTFIAHLVIKPDIKKIIIYGLLVLAFIVPLTLLNEAAYPGSHPYFWDLKSYEGEGHNQFQPTLERANLFARVMFLHSFVAPEPLIRMEEDIPFRKVWMFRASIKRDPMQISRYVTDLSRVLVVVWMALAALGGLLFLKNFRKQDNRISLTFILILLFNFALHMRYGKDVFLYSVNWTYAIVLLLALAWKELADKRWFQVSLLVFIALMMANNSQLIFTMLSTSALHIK
ncbi:MAG: hypothetical protein KJZ77_05485 [Anaerolineales bacterium]|nr:hypothetical protein [Anaerolineales bacterium]